MKRRGVALVLTMVAATICAPHAASGQTQPVPPSFLYVQQASPGRIEPGPKGAYTLELHVQEQMTVFADRPLRIAVRESVRQFVREWSAAGLDQEPPNAALALADAPATADTFAFTLTHPVYDAKTKVLRYRARLIHQVRGSRLVGFTKDLDQRPHGRFGVASLFIDSGSLPGSYWTSALVGIPQDFVGSTVSFTPQSSQCATQVSSTTNFQIQVPQDLPAEFYALNSGSCFFKDSRAEWLLTIDGPTPVNATIAYGGSKASGYNLTCRINAGPARCDFSTVTVEVAIDKT